MRMDSYKDKNWLYNQYWKQKKSARKIGKECSVSVATIIYWMEKFGIERRKNPKAKKNSRLKCYCGILIEKESWYYCPNCGRKVRHIKMMRSHGDIWEID